MKKNYNLALVCADKQQEMLLEQMSQALAAAAPTKYVLNSAVPDIQSSIAHISVLQFAAEEEQLSSIWQKAARLGNAFNVRVNAFYIQSKPPADTHTYIGLSVQNPDGRLQELHAAYLRECEPEVTPMIDGRTRSQIFPAFHARI